MDVLTMAEWNWSEFHFLRPAFLWLLLPAALLLWRGLKSGGGQDGWQQSCDPELLQAMQVQTAQKGSRWQWLYWPAALIAVLAISGPAVRKVPVPVVQNQSALVLALDVSRSMLSDDIKPSRLQRAKFKIKDLLDQRKDGQTALVVYAGDAFVVTPLTDDVETIAAMLEAIEPSIMPVKGTNTVTALEKSAELLKQSAVLKGEILLITDGISVSKTEDTLRQLSAENIKTHVMAVGTETGAPIPTPRGFVKDLRGQIVIPKLDFSALQQAATLGSGYFTVLSSGDDFAGMFDAAADLSENKDRSAEDQPFGGEDDMGRQNYIDDGPFLALLLLPMVALLYRRGLLLFLALGVVLPVEQSHALSWDELWLNKDQQAWKQLQNDQAAEAQKTALDPKIQAAAAYQNKQFKQAADLYQMQPNDLDRHYNQGNALAQSGDLEKALASYEQALTYDPNDEDTLYNKKIVEEALKQQQEQQQEQQGEQGDESDENQSGEQQDSEQSEQEQSEQEQQQDSEEQKQQANKDEQSEAEQEEQQQQEQAEQQESEQQQPQQEAELTPEEQALDAEEKQAMEQWLRRIKDDPGGLLRRKFLYQYHRRNQSGDEFQTTEDW